MVEWPFFSLKEGVAAPFSALSSQRRAWNKSPGVFLFVFVFFQSRAGAGTQGCLIDPTLGRSPPLPTVHFFLIKAEHYYSPVSGQP